MAIGIGLSRLATLATAKTKRADRPQSITTGSVLQPKSAVWVVQRLGDVSQRPEFGLRT